MSAPFMMKYHLAWERSQDVEDEGEAVFVLSSVCITKPISRGMELPTKPFSMLPFSNSGAGMTLGQPSGAPESEPSFPNTS